jgi:hypothetical protein
MDLVFLVGDELLENSPQGGKARTVDDAGFVAAEAQDVPSDAGNVVNKGPRLHSWVRSPARALGTMMQIALAIR